MTMRYNNKSTHILILERDVSFRETLAETLMLEDYVVSQAECGLEGIQLATEIFPDLILCASAFSDIHCWQIIRALRKEKSTRHIKFICLSSKPIKDEGNAKLEGDLVLIKPFDSKRLLDAIQTVLLSPLVVQKV